MAIHVARDGQAGQIGKAMSGDGDCDPCRLGWLGGPDGQARLGDRDGDPCRSGWPGGPGRQAMSGDRDCDPCRSGWSGGPDRRAMSGDRDHDPCRSGWPGGPNGQGRSCDRHRWADPMGTRTASPCLAKEPRDRHEPSLFCAAPVDDGSSAARAAAAGRSCQPPPAGDGLRFNRTWIRFAPGSRARCARWRPVRTRLCRHRE